MTTTETLDPTTFGPTAPPVNEQATADFFAVLSSPIRLSVLQLLVEGERCVTELVDLLRIAQPRLSNHLACLRNCGFVQVRRRGTFLHYSLADPRLADIVRLGASLAQPSSGALLRCSVLGEERET
jgi:ArsR family transcriptional regulator, cadmium/lead-responsive transcriptional repressor